MGFAPSGRAAQGNPGNRRRGLLARLAPCRRGTGALRADRMGTLCVTATRPCNNRGGGSYEHGGGDHALVMSNDGDSGYLPRLFLRNAQRDPTVAGTGGRISC